jgi:TRAP-type C4-dicarboxylate transport system substrate-binding protein
MIMSGNKLICTRLKSAAFSFISAFVLTTTGAFSASAQEIVLKTATSWNEKFPMAELLNKVLKSSIEENSGGKMSLDVHLAGSLCNQKTCVEQVKLGQLDIGTSSAANYGGFHKTYEILTLPYIFSDDAAAQNILGSYLFAELDKISIERDNMKVLAVVPFLGFRQLETNIGVVKSPADLRGTKIRVTKSPLDGALLRAWGAVATPIDWSETYDAVQQKVVRGLYVQKTVHAMMKFYEVAPNVTLTNGAWTPMLIFMDLKRFNALPDWARQAIDKSAADLRSKVFEIDARYAAKMGAANADKVSYYTPTPDEMAQWRKASAQAWLVGKKLNLYDAPMAVRILESQDGTQDFIAELQSLGAL